MQDLALENDSKCILVRSVFTKVECDDIVASLRDNIIWSKRKIKIFGRDCLQNRTTAHYGESGCTYCYSGTSHTGSGEIPDVIQHVHKEGVQRLIDTGVLSENDFNYYLLNRYRDGTENIGEHSDDERGLVGDIVSFSFGASRFFDIRRIRDKTKLRLELHSGDCILMGGNMQRYYKHGIPVQKKVLDERFNITLRQIV
tara:strand:+ start:408 stop:1004 length:597 start_codon:yes stop_codon:yes gene_type:complete